MNWIYNGKNFTEVPEGQYGFIYKITYTNGQQYIGQKQFYSQITLPALKTGVQRPNSTRVMKRRLMTKGQLAERTLVQLRTNVRTSLIPFDIVAKPMKWQTYEGSSKNTKDLTVAFKEILTIVETRRLLTYMECKALFVEGVLESDKYINDNILNKFHRGNL